MRKLFLMLLFVGSIFAASPDAILQDSYYALKEFLHMPEKKIPKKLLANAKAIAIIPGVIRGGFVIGGRYGEGILMVRHGRTWSDPVFVKLAGGSFGWQIGLESIDVMLVFETHESVDRLVSGKFTLGADASVAAGPVGRAGEASTDIKFKSEIYSYSKSRGIFAGLTLKGAVLDIDYEKTRRFYHASPRRVIAGNVHKANRYIQKIKALLSQY
ncbi:MULTISPECIES: lipid-binding SYLF domain-containing protein [unclassified Nitratiruptor]|uniref:lipid-binding SYLF domain-containing protein n=1 Tax=unclassified Nitratiruptor TaxID=2624044 RepID=UPI001915C32E|nr:MULTISPECIES: lipid-binding SYLF domain-containing protein [unclassified Nitratiruptor]BCD61032.1 hypothetical protein NitYY0810_C1813 [Nitratiruptor sp. YY08-10]BCD64964.1 hypothetical protein NitYY0814_C1821 [Nitratiruptor sp. YY08-14]